MLIVIRVICIIFYWIAIPLQPILKWLNRTKRGQIPKFRNEILNISASKLVAKLKSQEITSEELVREYIVRIKDINPFLNAVIEDRFAEAVEDAKTADKVITLTNDKEDLFKRFPLFGVPFTVKESCGVRGLSHVVGSRCRRGFKTEQDGAVVGLIRQAGAIPLLASANPELCVSWETSSLTHGRCCNPYNTKYTPGGSSGGEGALNGSGATVFGIGSDLCGSVRIPALFNGVFGHKPTGQLLSSDGHFPNVDEVGFDNLLQLGPITRFAEDLPMLLDLMAGGNSSKLTEAAKLDDIKIYYMDLKLRLTTVPINRLIQKAISDACKHFASRGNKIQKLEIEEMNDTLEIVANTLLGFSPPTIINPELKSTTILELKKHFTGKAIYSLNALFFQGLYDFGKAIPAFRKNHYLKRKEALILKLRAALGNNGVLFFPTFHREAFVHHTSLIHTPGTILSGLFNMIGFPSLHIPMGLNTDGLPIGFQVVAAPYADKNCFTVALELETVFGGWVPTH